MIGSVTQLQAEMLAAEKSHRREMTAAAALAPATATPTAPTVSQKGAKPAPPVVPEPQPEHIAWAKRVLGEGYHASPTDVADASRILRHAGLDPDKFHGGKEPDSAPDGARAIAEALRDRENAEADAGGEVMSGAHEQADAGARSKDSRKAFADRGISAGPARPVMPGRPGPDAFGRPYLGQGHAAESPQAEAPRANPMPALQQGIVTPVALPDAPVAATVPSIISSAFTMGSPSER